MASKRLSAWVIVGLVLISVQVLRAVIYPLTADTMKNSCDAEIYHTCAKALLEEGYLKPGPMWGCYWPPGWISVVAGVHWASGETDNIGRCYGLLRGLNVLLWLAGVYLTWRLGKLLLPPAACFLGVVLYAFDQPFFYIKITGYEELLVSLTVLVVLLFELMTRAPTKRSAMVLGVAIGITMLCQAKTLLIVGGLMTCGLAMRRVNVLSCLLALSVGAAFVLPWTYRNYVVSGRFIPVTSNGGINLWLGNNPEPNAGITTYTKMPKDWVARSNEDAEPFYYRLATDYMLRHPRRVLLELVPRKSYITWELDSWHQVVRLMLFLWVMARGLCTARARWRTIVLGVPVLVVGVTHAFYCVGDPRYRYPVIPLIDLGAAYAVIGIVRYLRGLRPVDPDLAGC